MKRHGDNASRKNVRLALNLNTGWIHWIAKRKYPNGVTQKDFQQLKDDRFGIERLIMKSISLLEAELWYETHKKYDFNNQSGKSSIFPLVTSKNMPAIVSRGVLSRGINKKSVKISVH